MTTETPRERFERVILPRVEKAGKAIELIGNGASRDYATTPEEIAELLNDLQQKLWEVQRRYAKRLDCEVTIFDAAEGGEAEGERGQRSDLPVRDDFDVASPPAEPAPATTAKFLGLNRHRLAMFVDGLDADLVAPLVTHLVNRLAEMAEGKESAT